MSASSATNATPAAGASEAPVRHTLYVPGYRMAKLGMAGLGVVLLGLSLFRLGPLVTLAVSGGSVRAEAVAVVRTDSAGETVYTADADVLTAMKKVEETWDRDSVFWVKYRFKTAAGKEVETLSPMGQHKKPMQMLRDSDGLPSTITLWYDPASPERVTLPWEWGTWFMPGMLVLFGLLGTFMGLMLYWHANTPIEMPDLSRSHGEADGNGEVKTETVKVAVAEERRAGEGQMTNDK